MGENRFKKYNQETDPNDPISLLNAGKTMPNVDVEPEPVVTGGKKNILKGVIEEKEEAKSYGFYLTKEAVSKLEKLAKQNKCSKSKALDALLKSIL